MPLGRHKHAIAIDMGESPARALLATAVVLTLFSALFATSVEVRAPFRTHLSLGHHQWLTASTVLFSRNWYREGIVRLRMTMLEEPAAERDRPLSQRSPYVSFPPGAVIPVFALSQLLGEEPSAELVMAYGLAVQLIVLWLLIGTALVTLRSLRVSGLRLYTLICVPPFIYLYAPGPFYFHQNVYFAEQAVMLPFALLLFLEAQKRSTDSIPSPWYETARALTLFWGTFTSWVFLPLAATLWVLHLANSELGRTPGLLARRSTALLWPVAMALGAFLAQLMWIGHTQKLLQRLAWVSGASAEDAPSWGEFLHTFFVSHIDSAYASSVLLGGSLVAGLVAAVSLHLLRRDRDGLRVPTRHVFQVLILAAVPGLAQALILPVHAYNHDFSVLPLGLAISLGPFCLIPALVLRAIEERRGRALSGFIWLVPLVAAVALFGAADRRSAFPPPWDALPKLGRFFQKNIEAGDAVFSPEFAITRHPPQMLAYTMKRVRKVDSLSNVRTWVEANPVHTGGIVILSVDPATDLSRFSSKPATSHESGLRMLRLARDDVLARASGLR